MTCHRQLAVASCKEKYNGRSGVMAAQGTVDPLVRVQNPKPFLCKERSKAYPKESILNLNGTHIGNLGCDPEETV